MFQIDGSTKDSQAIHSAEFLRAVIESFPGGLTAFDSQLNLLMANDNFYRIYDLDKDEFPVGTNYEKIGLRLAESGYFGPGDVNQIIAQRMRELRDFKPYSAERFCPKGRILQVRGLPLKGGGFITTVTDITDQKKTEQRIRTQSEQFNVALENIPAGVCVYDKDHRLVVSNANFAKMYGVAPDLLTPGTALTTVMERRIASGLFAGKSPEQYIEDRLNRIARSEPGSNFETLSDGRTIEITRNPLEDGGWLSIHEDISERVNAERAIKQSEAQLRAVMDNSPFCINLKDREGRYLYANQHYKDWWGVDAEIVGKTLEDLNPIPSRAAIAENVEEKVLETGQPFIEEVNLKRPSDGKIRDRLRIKFPVTTEDDLAVGVGTIAIDITDRKLAERAQKKSEELFLKAFHTNPSPLTIARADGEIQDVNDAWLKTFGYERDEVIGYTPDDLKLWNSIEERRLFLRQLIGAGALTGFECQLRKKNGALVDIVVSADLVNVNGEQRIFSTCIDITEDKKSKQLLLEHRDLLQQEVREATADLKQKAQELETALNREKELNELQRQFVAMASHEFRTPLAIIDSTAQRLKRRASRMTSDEALSRIDNIRDAVQRMTRLMESTLNAARMEEGTISVDPYPCDIGEIVADSCVRMQEISKGHVIRHDIRDLPPIVMADKGALEQILSNLISNAVKYSPGSYDVDVEAFGEADDVVIRVKDKGIGINEEDIPKMFTRYFRARTSTGIAGTGIGLNLVKKLVELHNGSIVLESALGNGTTFTVRLPISGPAQNEHTSSLASDVTRSTVSSGKNVA